MARVKVTFMKKLPGGKRKRVTFMRDTSKPRVRKKKLGDTPDFATLEPLPPPTPYLSDAYGRENTPYLSGIEPQVPRVSYLSGGVGLAPGEHQSRAYGARSYAGVLLREAERLIGARGRDGCAETLQTILGAERQRMLAVAHSTSIEESSGSDSRHESLMPELERLGGEINRTTNAFIDKCIVPRKRR
jgi:hypothetical protein